MSLAASYTQYLTELLSPGLLSQNSWQSLNQHLHHVNAALRGSLFLLSLYFALLLLYFSPPRRDHPFGRVELSVIKDVPIYARDNLPDYHLLSNRNRVGSAGIEGVA